MAATPSINNQEKISILEYEFDEKVYPGVTIIDTENIKMIWDEQEKRALTGFQITIKDFTDKKIIDAKKQTAPRLASIIGSISGHPISYKAPKITYIRNGRITYGVIKTTRIRWLREISIKNIEISKLSSLLTNYSRLYMELGHAHNGHRAFHNNDYPQAIREFYLVFENTGRAEEFKYKNLRHVVSHNVISSPDAVRDLRAHFRIDIQQNKDIDLNNPEIKKRLEEAAQKLRDSIGLYIQEQLKKELA
jgi:hypothetical protein